LGCHTPQVDGQLQGAWAMLVVVALVAYVSGYQFGYGPISWVMIGECFPLHSRTRALGVAAVTNFGINLIVTLTSGSLNAVVSQSTLFYFYAAMCVLSLVHIHFYVPETKGKTLEQIEALLAS
jgi:MFS family permease